MDSSLKDPASRFWIFSSVSVPLPRKRCSSTAAVGGAKNTKEQVFDNADLLTDSAPCTSMSSKHTLPFFVTSCTADMEVP